MKECWPSMFCKHAVHFLHTSLARDLPQRASRSLFWQYSGERARTQWKNIWIVAIGWINGLQTILCYFLPSAFLTASATTMYYRVLWCFTAWAPDWPQKKNQKRPMKASTKSQPRVIWGGFSAPGSRFWSHVWDLVEAPPFLSHVWNLLIHIQNTISKQLVIICYTETTSWS
jgi:hypothetical protein